jgi:hypothetical protein
MNMTYDELNRVAKFLEECGEECLKEALNQDIPGDDRSQWVSDSISYKRAAKKLRDMALSQTQGT